MATVYDQRSGNVAIGRVLSRAFGAITGNPGVMLSIAFLFGALPQAAIEYVQQILTTSRTVTTDNVGGAIGLILLVAFVSMVLALVVQGGLVRATMTEMEGGHATFGECFANGLSRAFPLLGVGLFVALGVGFGLLLLIVPGVIFYLMWSVAIPVIVVERRGVIESMSRSGELTKGARAVIFALMLIIWAVTIAAGMIAGVFATMVGGVDAASQTVRNGLPFAVLAVNAVVNTAVTVFAGVIPTALYVELREWKEGPISETLTEIFA